ncbi:PAS domain S-box protein [Fontimonas sp. SYSU GA230001]|uniref:PAS domain S-box protein n=1 Tax=Fontimonas sp. SYSU GA230001 TaxID=3142450 RepID=UPI0032B43DCC
MNPLSSQAPTAADDQLGALLGAAADAVVIIDERGIVTRFNAAAERTFGYQAAEVIGHNVSLLMPQPFRREHDGYLERYHRTGEPRIIGIGREVVAQRKDGSTFPIDLSVGEFRTGQGHGFVGILRDISERKRQEEMLRQSTEELRLIFEYSPMAILITDLHGGIFSANRACCELFGRSQQELCALRHSDLMASEDRKVPLEAFERLRRDGGSCECEVRYLRADGSVIHALHYSALATDEDGEPVMFIGEIIDRSELFAAIHEAEQLRARLAHVARIGTLGEMVSGIAHEVNQPLTAIANYASACRRLMLGGQGQPGELLGVLDKIAAQAERAGQVIRGLRALAKRGESQRQLLDCNQLVADVVRLVEFELRGTDTQLYVELDSGLPPVFVDGVQVQQVVLNLIRNAVEAMTDGPGPRLVSIRTSVLRPQWVAIRVDDRGPGLSAEQQQRLFEPFFTTKKQGMGLGLSICQSIASDHGGELRYCTNEWGGASFTLALPAYTDEEGI